VIYHQLLRPGADSFGATLVARNYRSYWANANTKVLNFTLSTRFFDGLGVPRLVT
jgi:hypothetical protein